MTHYSIINANAVLSFSTGCFVPASEEPVFAVVNAADAAEKVVSSTAETRKAEFSIELAGTPVASDTWTLEVVADKTYRVIADVAEKVTVLVKSLFARARKQIDKVFELHRSMVCRKLHSRVVLRLQFAGGLRL